MLIAARCATFRRERPAISGTSGHKLLDAVSAVWLVAFSIFPTALALEAGKGSFAFVIVV